MFKSLLIENPNNYSLIIRPSRWSSLFILLFYLIFFGFWYGSILGKMSSPQEVVEKIRIIFQEDQFMILFLLAPLIGLPRLLDNLQIFFGRKTFYFDSLKRTITKNNKILAEFREVEEIQIRRFSRSKEGDEYSLSIALKQKKKIKIIQSSDFENLCEAADEISSFIGVSIVTID